MYVPMNAAAKGAAVVALLIGLAACAPPYAGSYGSADDGSSYNRSDGSDRSYQNSGPSTYGNYGRYSTYGGYNSGYYVAPPPPRSAYDPGPTYYDTYPRTYYRDYYSNTESGWYDRWGRWHPSRAY
jgi:hypothetical protein